MDVRNPLRSIVPTVEADVLAVLVRSNVPLTGLHVQEMAGRSYGQVGAVLRRLVDHGIVDSEQYGHTRTYRLNRKHVVAPHLDAIVKAAETVEDRIRDIVAEWEVRASAIVVFGSFARRTGDESSDIDLLVVRPDGVDEEDDRWLEQRSSLVEIVESSTGNRVQTVELSRSELDEAIRTEQPLMASIRHDGVLLAGQLPKVVAASARLPA